MCFIFFLHYILHVFYLLYELYISHTKLNPNQGSYKPKRGKLKRA